MKRCKATKSEKICVPPYPMRNEKAIKELILNLAENDPRVRAVVLNGSRANPNVVPDRFQDFDVLFIVNDLSSFIDDPAWIDYFGERIILQLPDEATFGTDNHFVYHYLMLFKDENRIDLTLFPSERFHTHFRPDSLSIVWLDKDGLLTGTGAPTENDYLIRKPGEEEFLRTCNEFWWVCTYVVKGLRRKEVTYAKEMLEMYVRPMFMKLIEWKIGIDTDFTVSFGKGGKFMERYIDKELYEEVVQTYSGHSPADNWKALLHMTDLFTRLSNEISAKLGFNINRVEQENTTAYIRKHFNEQKINHL